MPIDPRIALGVQQSTFDPAAAMQNALAIRNARLQEQANQLKLQQEQQAAQEAAELQNYLTSANLSTPEGLSGLYRYGASGAATAKSIAERIKAQQEGASATALEQQRLAEYQSKRREVMDSISQSIAYDPSDANISYAAKQAQDSGLFHPSEIDEFTSHFLPLPYEQRKAAFGTEPKLGTYQPGDYTTASWAKFTTTKNPADLQLKPTASQIAATTEKPLTATQRAALKKSQVEDQTNISTLKSTADDLERLTDDLVGNATKGIAPDPGLKGITGAQALLPSAPKVTVGGVEITSGKARIAQQKLDTIKGKVMALGRQLATEHGKLGNMAVQEWKFISDAVQKIDPAADNFEDQLRDIVRQARDLESRARSRYEMQYEESSAPAADGKVQLSPQDQAALDWANKNPKDPRAAQIKAKLGVK